MWSEFFKRWMEMLTWWLPRDQEDGERREESPTARSRDRGESGQQPSEPAPDSTSKAPESPQAPTPPPSTAAPPAKPESKPAAGAGTTAKGASGDGGASAGDDLTAIKGIGEATRDRLARHGIHGFADLAGADPDTLTEALKAEMVVSRARVAQWIEAARERSG